MNAISRDEMGEKLIEAITLKVYRELKMRMELVGMTGQRGADRIRRLIEREVKRLERRRISAN